MYDISAISTHIAPHVEQASLFAEMASAPLVARPFLKWAGGKRQLLPILLPRVPNLAEGRYFEPFLGGGALFFSLYSQGRLGAKKARLSDINEDLINTYLMVRDHLEELIRALQKHKNEEEHYYRVRALHPKALSPVERAARFIFLNRTCYNGLFRENQKGQFNVPFGRYTRPQICNTRALFAAHHALQGVCIEVSSFDEIESQVQQKDFVYFDPPYAPISPTSSFSQYHASGFQEKEQTRLAQLVSRIAQKEVNVMLSNSTAPWLRILYQDFVVEEVYANRNINSQSEGRGQILELLAMAGPFAYVFEHKNRENR